MLKQKVPYSNLFVMGNWILDLPYAFPAEQFASGQNETKDSSKKMYCPFSNPYSPSFAYFLYRDGLVEELMDFIFSADCGPSYTS